MAIGEQIPGKAGRAARAASVILAAEAVSWLCYSYRFIDAKRYYICCGPGRMFEYLPMHISAAVIVIGSLLTLVAAAFAATGQTAAALSCWAVCVVGVLNGVARVVTPISDWRSTWLSPPPRWFVVVGQGWPTLIGCSVALVLLLSSSILSSRGKRRVVSPVPPGASP